MHQHDVLFILRCRLSPLHPPTIWTVRVLRAQHCRSVHSGYRQQAVRVTYDLCFVCARQECVRGHARTLSDSTFHPHSFFSITTAIPPAQALPLSLHTCTSTTIPSPPPWLGTSLADIHLVHWSQSASILSLLSSRAHSGFPLGFSIPRTGLRSFSPASSAHCQSLSNLFSRYSPLQSSNYAYRPAHMAYLFLCLLSSCEHIPLLPANPCLSLQDPASNTLLWEASSG